jgi:K+-transporting ATPase c subunit
MADLGLAAVERLIHEQHTAGRALGLMGEPGANGLRLNIELDQRYPD